MFAIEGMSSIVQVIKMPCPINMTQMADELIESHLTKKRNKHNIHQI